VEKPMARHTPECDAMIAACAAAKQKLFVAYYRRALPRFLKVKELLDHHAVGALTSVNYRQAMPLPVNADPAKGGWRLDVPTSGGGLLLDVGSHVLDLLDFFCGPLPLEHIQAYAARLASDSPAEDTVTMIFRTCDGVPAAATWNLVSRVREDTMEFSGTDGRLSFTVFGNEPLRLDTGRGVEELEFPAPVHIGQGLIQTMVDDLLGRGTCASTGESARRTSQVMDRILAGYYGGRDDAFWNRPETWPGFRSSR
jgi:1,5-anhydro-D-fructose reductase (1,5-anhydro-D-mannitol-forming)